jgi:hypothetical protein
MIPRLNAVLGIIMMNRDKQSEAAAAATVAADQPGVLLKDVVGQVAGCFPRRETC